MCYVYILQSKKNNKYYIGSTANITKRVKEHNLGQGGKFTKLNGPWLLVCYKNLDCITKAREEEKKVKSYKSGNGFKKIINGEVPEWLNGAPC